MEATFPEVDPEVKAWIARVAPELAQVRVRELPGETALDSFGRAAVSGWGSIDVLTHGVSGRRAPSISPERRSAPWTRPSTWNS